MVGTLLLVRPFFPEIVSLMSGLSIAVSDFFIYPSAVMSVHSITAMPVPSNLLMAF
jgi:hypothetical protein